MALATAALFWDGFVLLWIAAAIGTTASLLFFVFPVMHVAAGLWLTHRAIALILNRTHVRIDAATVRARRGPVPPGARVDLATCDVASFVVARVVRGAMQVATIAGAPPRWTVEARMLDGETVQLPLELQTAEQAAHVARRLDEVLLALRSPETYRA